MMSDEVAGRASASSLPDAPDLEWLRKEAKRRLRELRKAEPVAKLTDAQFALAKDYGFSSWRALKAHIDSLTIEGRLFAAAKQGDAATLSRLLDAHPDKLQARAKPYQFTLLHAGAAHYDVVDVLLRRGMDPDVREEGDNTTPMHWAAAAGKLDVVRRLADAGGEVIGEGDDHELAIIGWAICWDGGDDDAHRAVAEFLVSRGARHHIFSAIAMRLEDEVRRIVREDPSQLNRRMSRNELHQLPLHFAVRKNRPRMVELLVQLGADPFGVDGVGQPVVEYPDTPGRDAAVMEAIRRRTLGELLSASRGHRQPWMTMLDLAAALSLEDWELASKMWAVDECDRGFGDRGEKSPRLSTSAILHLMAKRGETTAVKWLLERGVDVNARWIGWDTDATPLHVAASRGHEDIVRLLLDAGADPAIKDSKHDADVLDWAEFFGQASIVSLLGKRGV
jgi:ankyrin repeat protein